MAEKLGIQARREALEKLGGWEEVPGRDALGKRYVFTDFNEAFGWMVRVALKAECMDHHPEWSNVYKTVDVVLTTHDAGGVSMLDIEMAAFMDKTAGRAGQGL